jgi:hypothetical protein
MPRRLMHSTSESDTRRRRAVHRRARARNHCRESRQASPAVDQGTRIARQRRMTGQLKLQPAHSRCPHRPRDARGARYSRARVRMTTPLDADLRRADEVFYRHVIIRTACRRWCCRDDGVAVARAASNAVADDMAWSAPSALCQVHSDLHSACGRCVPCFCSAASKY